MNIQAFKIFGISKSSLKGEIHHNTSIPQKTGKNSNTKTNLLPKGAGEEIANKTFTQQKKTVNKDVSRTQWNRDQKNCGTDQQNQELVLGKKIDKPLASLTKKKREKTQ